jgi:hypothetical protein
LVLLARFSRVRAVNAVYTEGIVLVSWLYPRLSVTKPERVEKEDGRMPTRLFCCNWMLVNVVRTL